MNNVVSPLLALCLLFAAPLSHAQSAVDERAIIAAASALDAAIDAKDWEGARALLLDEVSVALPGEEPLTMAADELVGRWREALHPGKLTFHLRGGERVVFDGADSAVLRSKAQVSTHVDGVPGDDVHELFSDYHHELDRTENGWRVRHYGYVPRLERGNVAVIRHRLPPKAEAEAEGAPEGEASEEAADDGAADAADEGGTQDEAPAAEAEAGAGAAGTNTGNGGG